MDQPISRTVALRARLDALRGDWKTIAHEAEVSYKTVLRLASGDQVDFLDSTVTAITRAVEAAEVRRQASR